MKAVFLAALVFMVMDANATALPPVPTNIVNAPKAQFIGSFITSATGKVPTTVTPLNPQFKDCSACMAWIDGSALTSQVAKFTNAAAQSVWATSGFIGYVGDCVDSNTGNICSDQQ